MKYVDPETGKVFEFELTPEELEACTKQPAMVEMFGSICKNQQDSKIKQLELRNDFSKSITNLVDHLVNAYLDYKEIQSSNNEEFLDNNLEHEKHTQVDPTLRTFLEKQIQNKEEKL